MKTKITLSLALGLLIGACTTGSYVTNGYDDIYYSPQNASIPIVDQQPANESTHSPGTLSEQSSGTAATISSQTKNNNSSVMENYIFQNGDSSSEVQRYNMQGMEMVDSDTTVLQNDSGTNYVINNYYDADDIDYTSRINRFHRFGFYDPFMWDSWNYDPFYYDPWAYNYYWPGSFGIGFGSYGWGMGFGFNYGWNSPYYSYYGGYPYYGGYNYWGYNPGRYNHDYYGNRDYRPRGNRSSYSTINRSGSTHPQVKSVTDMSSVSGRKNISSSNGRNITSQSGINSSTIYESRRINNPSSNGVKTNSSNNGNRTSNSAYKSSTISNTTSIRGVSGNGRSYTPSYTKPRTVTRSSYNTRSSTGSSSTKSGSVNNYRSSSTFKRGSVRGTENSTSRSYTPTVRSSGSNYSTRSSSSYSSGGSISTGSSHSSSHGGSPRR